MFPEMRSVLVGGQSVKFHSQVAYFCVCISLSAFGVGHVLSVQPWSLDGNYLGVFLILILLFLPPGKGALQKPLHLILLDLNPSLKKQKRRKNAGSTADPIKCKKKKEVMKYLYLIASQQDTIFAQFKCIWSF